MNKVNDYPTDFYVYLPHLIDFSSFDYDDNYQTQEVELLQPQLEELGYTDIQWLPGETDKFGPLSRVCKARSSDMFDIWFVYG